MLIVILAFGARPGCLMQECFQAIELNSGDVGTIVEDDSCGNLSLTLEHHSGLVVIDLVAFQMNDCCDLSLECANAAGELPVSGKQQIVGVTREVGPGRTSQPGEALIDPEGTQVCNCR